MHIASLLCKTLSKSFHVIPRQFYEEATIIILIFRNDKTEAEGYM